MMHSLLQDGKVDVNDSDLFGETALLKAAKQGRCSCPLRVLCISVVCAGAHTITHTHALSHTHTHTHTHTHRHASPNVPLHHGPVIHNYNTQRH